MSVQINNLVSKFRGPSEYLKQGSFNPIHTFVKSNV
jgi:hypothetical protein